MIAAAIEHQFKRPKLARILDFEEARLPFDVATQNVNERVGEIAMQIIGRLDFPILVDVRIAARDVIAVIKGIVDASGSDADVEPAAVERRVKRAVFGYLSLDDGAQLLRPDQH